MPTEFTPVSALIGGALIGLAATLLLVGTGRIAGINGILDNVIESHDGRGWRLAVNGGAAVAGQRAVRHWLGRRGLLPRPAVANLAHATAEAFVFIAALLAGSQLARFVPDTH